MVVTIVTEESILRYPFKFPLARMAGKIRVFPQVGVETIRSITALRAQ